MADDSLTPPPPNQGGGSAKYLIALLLLLGGGLGVYFATRQPEAPPAPPPPPVKNADRNTALDNNIMAIPEDEPDAAAPVPEQAPVVKKPRPVVTGDPWECAGDVAPKDITKVLNESQSAIRSCYERELRNDNALQGDLKLQVKIGTDGAVASTRVRGSLNHKQVRECVQNIAKRWSFPAPIGGPCAVFDAPYNFMPKN